MIYFSAEVKVEEKQDDIADSWDADDDIADSWDTEETKGWYSFYFFHCLHCFDLTSLQTRLRRVECAQVEMAC